MLLPMALKPPQWVPPQKGRLCNALGRYVPVHSFLLSNEKSISCLANILQDKPIDYELFGRAQIWIVQGDGTGAGGLPLYPPPFKIWACVYDFPSELSPIAFQWPAFKLST